MTRWASVARVCARHLAWLMSLLCWASVALAARPHAESVPIQNAWVSWVMDGDTVLFLPEGAREAVRLRLLGIDAPELCQPGGEAARDALIARVLHRTVRVQVVGQDSYGRQLGHLWLDTQDKQDVAADMVRSGWAWAYQHRTGRGPYAALQRQAERERVGVFAARETAMSPAVFRQFHGSCHAGADAQSPQIQAPLGRVPQTGHSGSR